MSSISHVAETSPPLHILVLHGNLYLHTVCILHEMLSCSYWSVWLRPVFQVSLIILL